MLRFGRRRRRHSSGTFERRPTGRSARVWRHPRRYFHRHEATYRNTHIGRGAAHQARLPTLYEWWQALRLLTPRTDVTRIGSSLSAETVDDVVVRRDERSASISR